MSSAPDLSRARWVKSSHSGGNGGQCVEWAPDVAATHGTVPVRDSKNPTGPTLTFTPTGWKAFVYAVTRGEFTT
ncbi:toxin-antitoxin system toxin subunit [Wenjunlia vitaminophila]|uniref:Toxin-antitoxin system toxin subunit n=1 Tax=Wenjunlia vitaminophila TaxID=76728 RepID=A0A0T6LR47_WENVI|nr:DUF397 domain-containing protein [Wenjunlia vitaminophila]KRV48472.1 toxin-antitoxin system toxin subunit [Wenjunlia vitaminophila]